MGTDTQLEITERVAFWQIVFEREYKLARAGGYGKVTARNKAAGIADLAFNQRFPYDYK